MRINIENCSRTGGAKQKDWALEELVRNLKELRDRTNTGDMTALAEFFSIFVFDDNQEFGAAPVSLAKLGAVNADPAAKITEPVAEKVCTYPDCKCPFDALNDPWCARGWPKNGGVASGALPTCDDPATAHAVGRIFSANPAEI